MQNLTQSGTRGAASPAQAGILPFIVNSTISRPAAFLQVRASPPAGIRFFFLTRNKRAHGVNGYSERRLRVVIRAPGARSGRSADSANPSMGSRTAE